MNTKHKKLNMISLGTLALIVVAFVVVINLDFDKQNNITSNTPDISDTKESSIDLPEFDSEVLLCSEGAKQLYDDKLTIEKAVRTGTPYAPFVFQYNLEGKNGKLVLSEYADLSNAKEYVLSSDSTSLSIDNLYTGTNYYYEVIVEENTYIGSFKTAESTRFIKLPGVYNTRDIGGYKTLDGKTVKQGLIIRGTEIDGLVVPTYFLDSDYIEYVENEFGFVCDMDLREKNLFTADYKSRLGESVSHQFYQAPMYGSIFSENYKQAMNDIFSSLADPNNYPMYLHCTYGADRTGTIIFLLQGILNVSEEDMMTEYRLTGFFDESYATNDNITVITSGLQHYQGNSLQEKIKDYLISIGITEEEILSIQNILLEN